MTYTQIIEYFTSIAKKHNQIKYTAHGDFDRILGAERDKISYPCMWIESPTAKLIGDADSPRLSYYVAFVILLNGRPDDETQIDANIENAQKIALEIIGKILYDFREGALPAVSIDIDSFNLEIVWSDANDNDQGWRVEFSINTKTLIKCKDFSTIFTN